MVVAVSDSIPRSGNRLIDGLIQGGSRTTDGSPAHTAHQLTYSLDLSPSGVSWSADVAKALEQALTAWSNVADISFTKVGTDSSVQFNLDASADLAFALANGEMRRHHGLIGFSDFPDPNTAAGFFEGLTKIFHAPYDSCSRRRSRRRPPLGPG